MSDRDTITLPREVVQDALDALEWAWGCEHMRAKKREAITALRNYLAAPRLEVTVDPRLTAEEAAAISAALAAEQPKHDLMKWAKDAGSSPEDLERFATYTIATRDMEIATLREENEALRRDAERWQHWRDSHGFAKIDHEGGRCFVTLICDCDDPDQVRAKRFRGEDSFEWLDAFTDAAMEEKR